jgi:hypothetical protein
MQEASHRRASVVEHHASAVPFSAWKEFGNDSVLPGGGGRVGERLRSRRWSRLGGASVRLPDLGTTAMIIRQTLNFGANLVGGIILGVLAVAVVQMCRYKREERLEPRYPRRREPSVTPQTPEVSAAASAI